MGLNSTVRFMCSLCVVQQTASAMRNPTSCVCLIVFVN